MDIQATKLELVKQLLNVDKESVLKKIKDILSSDSVSNNEKILAYTVQGEGLTKEQYIQTVKDAEQRIENGQFTSHEDLLKEVKNW